MIFDWRQAASRAGLTPLAVVLELRKDWPRNSGWNQPSRKADVDRLAADPEMAPVVEGVIVDLASKGASL